MASVFLNFVPPNDVPDLVKLHIYEAPAQAGPFSSIEVVTAIGSPGGYITDYTTNQALSETDWFAIQWENSKGAFSEMSSAIQGGTTSVVSEVVERVLLRDPTLKEQIVAQEAAAVVEGYCGTVVPDPATLNYNELSGLTLLTMARCYLVRVASGTGTSQSWTAGLLTEKQSTATATQTLKSIEDLIRVANTWLGRTYTVVALMKEVSVAGGYTSRLMGVDISRSLVELGVGPIPPPYPTIEMPTNGNKTGGDDVKVVNYEFGFDTPGIGTGIPVYAASPGDVVLPMTYMDISEGWEPDYNNSLFPNAYLFSLNDGLLNSQLRFGMQNASAIPGQQLSQPATVGSGSYAGEFKAGTNLILAVVNSDGTPYTYSTVGRAKLVLFITSSAPRDSDGGTTPPPTPMTGEQIPAGGDVGDVLRRSGVLELAWTAPPVLETSQYQYSNQTAAADPGNGKVRLNNSDLSLATEMYISTLSSGSVDITAILNRMVAGEAVRIQDKNDMTIFARYKVTAVPASSTGWFTLSLEYREGAGNFQNNAASMVTFFFDTLMAQ